MTAKTMKNKVGTRTRAMIRKQQAISRRNKLASSQISNESDGRERRSDFPKSLRWTIKKMKKDIAGRKAWLAFEAGLCAIEEKQFGELPDHGLSNISFKEKSFGFTVPQGHKYCRTSTEETHDLSSIVVSLALFDGDKMLFACSGIPVPGGKTILRLTRFVTSARLVKAFKENRYKDDKLRIAVGLPDNTTADGFLGLYDDDIAIVTSIGFREVHPVDMGFHQITSIGTTALAAGRAFDSRNLMATPGSSSRESPGTFHFDSMDFTEAVLGGPLIGNDEIFLGMIIDICDQGDVDVRRASFLPSDELYNRLEHFKIINHNVTDFRGYKLPKGVSTIYPSVFMKTIYHLKSFGYPMPPPLVLEFNGKLLNRFEEHFGEYYAWRGYPFGDPPSISLQHIWEQLDKQVVTDISRRVVSLASFHGCVRYFTCTGLLIKWPANKATRNVILTSASLVRSCVKDEIDRDLRIDVFLPPKQRASGKLEFYNLNYNVAIISVQRNFIATRPEDIFNEVQKSEKVTMQKSTDEVLAIGREIEEGLLMATTGQVNRRKKSSNLDCKDLKFSTCKLTKVGIGGPLISFDGSFIGMNFYDGSEVTPFLPRRSIVKVLRAIKYDWLPSECGLQPVHIEDEGVRGKTKRNEWPVPEPYWYHGALDVSMYAHKHIGRVLN